MYHRERLATRVRRYGEYASALLVEDHRIANWITVFVLQLRGRARPAGDQQFAGARINCAGNGWRWRLYGQDRHIHRRLQLTADHHIERLATCTRRDDELALTLVIQGHRITNGITVLVLQLRNRARLAGDRQFAGVRINCADNGWNDTWRLHGQDRHIHRRLQLTADHHIERLATCTRRDDELALTLVIQGHRITNGITVLILQLRNRARLAGDRQFAGVRINFANYDWRFHGRDRHIHRRLRYTVDRHHRIVQFTVDHHIERLTICTRRDDERTSALAIQGHRITNQITVLILQLHNLARLAGDRQFAGLRIRCADSEWKLHGQDRYIHRRLQLTIDHHPDLLTTGRRRYSEYASALLVEDHRIANRLTVLVLQLRNRARLASDRQFAGVRINCADNGWNDTWRLHGQDRHIHDRLQLIVDHHIERLATCTRRDDELALTLVIQGHRITNGITVLILQLRNRARLASDRQFAGVRINCADNGWNDTWRLHGQDRHIHRRLQLTADHHIERLATCTRRDDELALTLVIQGHRITNGITVLILQLRNRARLASDRQFAGVRINCADNGWNDTWRLHGQDRHIHRRLQLTADHHIERLATCTRRDDELALTLVIQGHRITNGITVLILQLRNRARLAGDRQFAGVRINCADNGWNDTWRLHGQDRHIHRRLQLTADHHIERLATCTRRDDELALTLVIQGHRITNGITVLILQLRNRARLASDRQFAGVRINCADNGWNDTWRLHGQDRHIHRRLQLTADHHIERLATCTRRDDELALTLVIQGHRITNGITVLILQLRNRARLASDRQFAGVRINCADNGWNDTWRLHGQDRHIHDRLQLIVDHHIERLATCTRRDDELALTLVIQGHRITNGITVLVLQLRNRARLASDRQFAGVRINCTDNGWRWRLYGQDRYIHRRLQLTADHHIERLTTCTRRDDELALTLVIQGHRITNGITVLILQLRNRARLASDRQFAGVRINCADNGWRWRLCGQDRHIHRRHR
ncbi:hypothetical protein C6Q18_17750 [Pseudomonas chlororaphis subsp. piscium]|nr:hypothetical protein C6Q18_17750 [Pseudomonas chlororaphis subsp. piscium]